MPWRSVVRRSTSCISAAVRAFIGKKVEYSVAREERLAKARDDDRHVIGLLGSAGPLFGSGHERFGDHERGGAVQTDSGFLQPADSKLFAVDILRFHEAVAIANEHRVRTHNDGALLIAIVLDDAEDHAAFVQAFGFAVTDEE